MNLVEHAKRELELVETDRWVIDGMVKVVEAFAEMGHSGGSASIAIPMLNDLLRFKNLSPLTDNPEEWQEHPPELWDGKNSIWQNRRNGEAFSENGGKTYYLLSETEGLQYDQYPRHTANHFVPKED